ncbi:MAG: YfbK domain-containing protein [Flavobacterium sp.]
MENQDKLYQQFKDAAGKAEGKGFDRMEAVWNRVEEKLDKKKKRRVFPIWQYASVAAILLICLTVGGYIITNDGNSVVAPKALPENEVSTAIDTHKVEEVLNPEKVKQQPEVVVIDSEAIELKPEEHFYGTESKKTSEKDTVRFGSVSLQTSGTITDINNMPIPGVLIENKVNGKQSITDFDGKYTIDTKLGDSLMANYAGMIPQTFVAANTGKVNLKMKESVELHQVVVEQAYGNVSKSAIVAESYISSPEKKYRGNKDIVLKGNNDVKTVGNGTVEQSPRASFIQNLEGRVPGLKVETGKPKGNSTVILRGRGSINGNTEPLYVIDGVPANSNVFRHINPNKIERIDVLKDASATSLYGNRGKDGVIIITTKNLTRKEKRALKKLMNEKPVGYIDNATLEFKPMPVPEIQSQEDYSSFEENKFESPKTTPLSTFSIDVDNASYTNIRRFINNGQKVPKDAVRIEEMINFFKYEYGQPKDGTPFAMHTEYGTAPWNPKHKLLKIGLQGKDVPMGDLPASNLVFLIDVSGSMNAANKLPLLKQSMKLLINQMRKEDRIAIVVYASASGLVLPSTSGAEKEKIIAALDNLSAGGGTAGGEGIELAYKTAQEHFIKNGNNRVILATDGDFNVGASSNTDMQTLIEEKRKSGVFLTCLGYGMGNYKDSKMEILANKGNGNYAYIDNMQEADRFLQKEFKGSMFALAKDVKIQIEFNPAHVQSYRLIGYENRKLRDEDFANDAIDAGELGTGHTVTALYEIIPTGVDSEFYKANTQLKYTAPGQPTGNYGSELATIKFRYKKPDEDKSREIVKVIPNVAVLPGYSTADFNFASAVAWFGLKLRDSDLIPNKKTEDIKALAKKGIKNDPDGYRAEFVRLVETAQ